MASVTSSTPSTQASTAAASHTTSRSRTVRPRQVIAPLTTTFTPAPECSHWTDSGPGRITSGTLSAQCVAFYSVVVCNSQTTSAPPCLPTGSTFETVYGAFYSPGLFCPSGWQPVASVTAGEKGDEYGFKNAMRVDALLPDETAIACCPSNYAYYPIADAGGASGICTSNVVTNPVSYKSCVPSSFFQKVTRSDIGEYVTVNYTQQRSLNSASSTRVWFAGIQVIAPTVQINHRPQDRSLAPTSSQSSIPTNGTNGGDGGGSQGSTTATLGPGGIAGVVVGVCAFVAGLVVFSIWAYRRRRAKLAEAKTPHIEDNGNDTSYVKPELDSAEQPRLELEDSAKHELDAATSQPIVELEGDNTRPRSELPGH
ncbi:syndecan domain-containing protein [Purpureocillium lavendulum]|uniref:Syndecan domain-containing protein n=1 Tax=Purpureocillium lavendulum TaxID=1247861 RepID=A0AB34FWY3_9HYPO|nr:syndecan domain-containing protein [Purpureocillium lavendulum]